MPSKAERYWRQYLASLPADVDPPQTYIDSFSFGFNPRDASEIATLVIEGTKSATGSVLWSYEADGKPIPRTGDHSIVNDGHGEPVCILRTTAVSILPFDEVPEIYAFQGGEGDRTLATWRPMYWRYIVSECERIDREPSEKAPLVMERFTVVYCEPLLEPGTGPDGDAGGAGPMPDFYAEDLAYVHHVGFRGVPEAAARWLVAYLSRHDVPDGAVLDLACGSGVFAAGAARTGRPVLGIDASRAMVALARRTAPAARFEVGSIYEADLPECAVVAIIGEGLNYVPATRRRTSARDDLRTGA